MTSAAGAAGRRRSARTPKATGSGPAAHIHDLAGNVWEWVEDAFAPLANDPVTDPVVRLDVSVHAIRGGGWNRSYAAMVVTYRGAAHYTYQVPALGFRCVRGEPLADARHRTTSDSGSRHGCTAPRDRRGPRSPQRARAA